MYAWKGLMCVCVNIPIYITYDLVMLTVYILCLGVVYVYMYDACCMYVCDCKYVMCVCKRGGNIIDWEGEKYFTAKWDLVEIKIL